MTKQNILLGVDPSFGNCGVCLYDPVDKSMRLKTGDAFEMMDWVGEEAGLDRILAVVENPNMDSTTFDKWAIMQNKITALRHGKCSMKQVKQTFDISMNYAQSVGENKSAAKRILKILSDHSVPVLQVAPSSRQRAYRMVGDKTIRLNVRFLRLPTKTTLEQFKQLTGYGERCSEHARDAATLVWDKSPSWVINQIKINQALR